MLRFKGADLRPVLAEAVANQCQVILVKDQGVYFLAERGERTPERSQKLLAYAVGCNPAIDPFDDWWELARIELGGDDLELSTTTHLSLQVVPPTPSKD